MSTPDPTLVCPHCKKPIQLTETLAAPLIEAARREALAEAERRQVDLVRREEELRKAQAAVDEQVAHKLREQSGALKKAAREAAAADLDAQMKDLREELATKSQKLAESQQHELELRKAKRELEEQRQALALEKERQFDEERKSIRESVQKELDENARLRMAEKEKVIGDLQSKIEELRRRAEQGSQQLQGEVQELDLEETLRLAFPADTIEPVAKGVRGADCLQRVIAPSGAQAGTILWESKRTKNWSEGWLAKLREDQREAKAEMAILVTSVLPKSIARFGPLDGIWVTDLTSSVPLAHALRSALVQAAAAKSASTGRETKMELLYEYLCGPQFRQRVEAIVEAFSSMKADLEQEKKAMTRAWSKREKQIERVLLGTSGMYGDLQGIAGSALPELPSLELPAADVAAEPPLLPGRD